MNKDTASLNLHPKTSPAEYLLVPFCSVSAFKSKFSVFAFQFISFPQGFAATPSLWPVSLLSLFQGQQHGPPKIQLKSNQVSQAQHPCSVIIIIITIIIIIIMGEQGWRSGESNRLSPMWPGFGFFLLLLVLVLAPEEVFLRVLRFSPLLKNQHFKIPKFSIRTQWTKSHLVDVPLLIPICLFFILSSSTTTTNNTK